MSNRVFLVQASSPIPDEEYDDNDVLAGASYMIPVFWYACFKPNDIAPKRVELEDGSTTEIPYIVTTREYAINNLKNRKILLLKYLPVRFEKEYNHFLKLLEDADKEYIHLHTIELWMMHDEGDFESDCEKCLRAFDEEASSAKKAPVVVRRKPRFLKRPARKPVIPPSWTRLLKQADIDPGKISETAEDFKLTGYGWFRKVPWEEEAGE